MRYLYSARFSRSTLDPEISDTSLWPTVDEQVIKGPESRRRLYINRAKAITLYLEGVPGKKIEANTNIPIREISRLRARCLKTHPDGRIWGFRALIPGIHQKDYHRKAKVTLSRLTSEGGAGAFGQILETYPVVKDLIDRHVLKLKKRGAVFESRIRIQSLHTRVLDKLRELGVEARNEYPFSTKNVGYVSLSKHVHKLIADNPQKAIAANYGHDALKKDKTSDGANRPVTRVFERVECDAHKIDAIFCILIPSLFGELIPRVVKRLWVIVIKEVVSRAVLGYYLSLNRECNAQDVLQAIKHALSPWKPRDLIVPQMRYKEDAGFPSSYSPRFIGACWDEFSIDGALAERCSRVIDKLELVVGAKPLRLKRGPDDRPFIESFFRTLEERGFHRLPNTTGSNPGDILRNNPEFAACRFYIQIEHLEDLLDVLFANSNAMRHSSIGSRTPLGYLDYLTQGSGSAPRQADPDQVRWLHSLYKKTRVRGSIEQGRRPFIHFEGVNYTSDVLRKTYRLCGKIISIEADPHDLRTMRAFTPDGAELGILKAAPPWQLTPHSIAMRKAINSLAERKVLDYSDADPVIAFLDYCEQIVRDGKPAPPAYLEARRLLVERIDELRTAEQPLAPLPIAHTEGSATASTPLLPASRRAING